MVYDFKQIGARLRSTGVSLSTGEYAAAAGSAADVLGEIGFDCRAKVIRADVVALPAETQEIAVETAAIAASLMHAVLYFGTPQPTAPPAQPEAALPGRLATMADKCDAEAGRAVTISASSDAIRMIDPALVLVVLASVEQAWAGWPRRQSREGSAVPVPCPEGSHG